MGKKQNKLVLVLVAMLITSCASRQISDQVNTPTVPDSPFLMVTPSPKITITPYSTPKSTPTENPSQITNSTPLFTSTQPETCGKLLPDRSIYIDENPTFSIRQGPGCEYEEFHEKIIRPYPITFFDVLGKYDDWLFIDLCNDKQGWIFAPAIAKINLEVALNDLPLITPMQTPEMSATSLSGNESSNAIDQASNTLISFFDFLYNQNYEEATKLFGGGYGVVINWNSDVDPNDYPTLLMRGCEWNGFQCFLRVSKLIKAEQISPMEYHFIVVFINPDGSLYQRRGVNDTVVSQFLFRVAKNCNGKYFVVDWPFYEQYGG